MMLPNWISRFDYKGMGIFSSGIFIKLYILHYLMGVNDRTMLITINNFLLVIAIFMLTSMLNSRRKNSIYLGINIFLSTIIFIDIIYYSHFFTLAPAHSIFQIGQLAPVSESIFSLIRLEYFLIFTDSALLWKYGNNIRGTGATSTSSVNMATNPKRHKQIALTIVLGLFLTVVVINHKTIENSRGVYTPFNLGVINYHLYDVASHFAVPVNLEHGEGIIEAIEAGAEDNKSVKSYFGLAKNKNVIVIQAESIQSFVINKKIDGQEITPVLNQLLTEDSIYFSRFYEQVGWGNTSDAEFVSHNGFYPSIKTFSYKAFEENDFVTLPGMLKKYGDYSSIAFHGNVPDFWNRKNIYPSQGINRFISLDELDETDEMIGIGLSDGALFRQSIQYLKEQPQPFYSFYITLTSHHPFTMPDHYQGLGVGEQFEGTTLGKYLETIHYMDQEIGNFIKSLKEEGFYEDSIIVVYGDHQGLDMRNEDTNEQVSVFLEKDYDVDEMFRVPLIIHMPDSKLQKEVTRAGGQIDFFPTMANLLGLELEPNTNLGKDLLNIEQGFVATQVHLARGSFIDDNIIFSMSNDGIFENSRAWNIHTGEPVDLEECRAGYERVLAEVNLSQYILHHNLVPVATEHGLEYIIQEYQSSPVGK